MILARQSLYFSVMFIFLFEFGTLNAWALEAPSAESTTTFWQELAASSTASDWEATPAATSSAPAAALTRPLIAEPKVRVGLYKTNQAVLFQSDFPYEILAGNESQGVLEPSVQAKLDYSAGVYYFRGGGVEFATTTYLRLVPGDWREIFFTIISYSRPVRGRGAVNFNAYRGGLEYHFSIRSGLPYIINELPLESYVAGIAESSNAVPAEYAKALLTAGRTYAYKQIGPPSSSNHLFDVYPNTNDQIYLGYNSELMMPNIVAAARATTGEMVTYQGEPVITPYFGNSSGKTRTWPGTGARARTWLKSIVAKYDKGRKLWGHGYGMSTRDAELRAKKDGWHYRELLGYYYTSTTVEKIY